MINKIVRYITHWEDWHWLVKYIFIAPAWFWLCLRARSFWFFTPSNPGITFGGYIGETKREIYEQLPTDVYPRTTYISAAIPFAEVSSRVSDHNFSFPIAVKPDVAEMGFMFRKIESVDQLRQYHEAIAADYIIQEFISYPIEVSVFYYRFPNEQKGHITGFVRKEPMSVVGDGQSTLKELIGKYPRATFMQKEMFAKHESKLETIIPRGETYYLSHALNLSRGGKLVSLEHEKDERLLKVFDDLSHDRNFYYGRYDISCKSIEDLKCGRNFSILEYNGCGAEPHHVYGNGYSLFEACRILVRHWTVLYKISMANYRTGMPRWNFMEGTRFVIKSRRHLARLQQLDATFEFNSASHRGVETILDPTAVCVVPVASKFSGQHE